jgi:hypothetical protein
LGVGRYHETGQKPRDDVGRKFLQLAPEAGFHHFLKHGRQAFRGIAVGVQQATATVAGEHEEATVRFAATNGH